MGEISTLCEMTMDMLKCMTWRQNNRKSTGITGMQVIHINYKFYYFNSNLQRVGVAKKHRVQLEKKSNLQSIKSTI